MDPDQAEDILAAAFGDGGNPVARQERRARCGRVAYGLGMRGVDLYLAAKEDPVEELKVLERRYRSLARGVVDRSERREMDNMVSENRARHDEVRAEAEAQLRSQRLQRSLGERLDRAFAQARLLSTVPASKPGSGARGKPESRPPSKALDSTIAPDGPDELTISARYQIVFSQLVERFEHEVDVSLRRPLTGAAETETLEERDKRLMQWAGIASHVVATLDPTLGSARTIENARHRLGLRRVDGTEQPSRRPK